MDVARSGAKNCFHTPVQSCLAGPKHGCDSAGSAWLGSDRNNLGLAWLCSAQSATPWLCPARSDSAQLRLGRLCSIPVLEIFAPHSWCPCHGPQDTCPLSLLSLIAPFSYRIVSLMCAVRMYRIVSYRIAGWPCKCVPNMVRNGLKKEGPKSENFVVEPTLLTTNLGPKYVQFGSEYGPERSQKGGSKIRKFCCGA